MVRRLWASLRRDNLINLRNHYFTVVLLVALIYLVATRLLIPADLTLKPDLYLVDQTRDGRFAAYVQQEARKESTAGKAYLSDNPEQLRQRMAENRNSVGVVVAEGSPLPAVTLHFQTYHNSRVRNLLAVSLEDELRRLYGQPWPVHVEVQSQALRAQGSAASIPLNQILVPVLLFSDAAMVGLLFIAALIFMEKEEGTLRAYLVTPGRPFEYLLSKALTLALLAVLFTLILVPLTLGGRPNYPHLLALMVLASVFTSLLGAWVAIYFENFAQFLFPGVVLIIAISLPGIAYVIPSFSPLWLQWLPTYPLVFALREAAFPTGSPQIVYGALLGLLAMALALLALASAAFKRRVARD